MLFAKATKNMPEIVIEKATVEDAAAILELQQQAYQEEAKIYNDYSIPPLRQTLAEIQADFEQQLFLKAVAINPDKQIPKIIGSVRAYIKEGTCYVGRLIVDPAWQNKGIGSRLMQEIEQSFEQVNRFELFTGYKSERNLYLYQKLGYRVFKNRPVADNLMLVYLEKFKS